MVNSCRKGKDGEREAASFLRDVGFVGAARGQQHAGGPDSPDIKGAIHGIHFEVKRTEKLNLYDALMQASADAGDGEVPVVMHRRDRHDWVMILPASRMIEFSSKVIAELKTSNERKAKEE